MKHAFSTRLGGCSSGNLFSLNTAFHVGDNSNNVLENRHRFFQLFDCVNIDSVSLIQVHGTEIVSVGEKDRGEGSLPDSFRQKGDALITTISGMSLTAYSADCLLIYIFAPRMPLAAIAHAGWRGTLGGIGLKVVRFLKDNFGLKTEDLLVAFSPSICRNCYKVSGEVAEMFEEAGYCNSLYLEPERDSSWKLDLAAINMQQLLGAGVKENKLALNSWCTACEPDLFYSYRRDKGKTGRMIGFMAIT